MLSTYTPRPRSAGGGPTWHDQQAGNLQLSTPRLRVPGMVDPRAPQQATVLQLEQCGR